MLIIEIGKSGAGKDTVARELCKNYGYSRIVTYTTRKKRRNEKDGVDYHFVNNRTFEQMIADGKFLEYKFYKRAQDNEVIYYGSPIDEIRNMRSDDKKILILTPKGYRDFHRQFQNTDLEFTCIYIYANRTTIKSRLEKRRTESKDEIVRRIEADNADFKGAEELAWRIVYNNSDTTPEKVADYINTLINKKEKENAVDENSKA